MEYRYCHMLWKLHLIKVGLSLLVTGYWAQITLETVKDAVTWNS